MHSGKSILRKHFSFFLPYYILAYDMQLFGFRNPFVQRLLRELVANGHGVAERSSVVATFCDRGLKLEHERVEEPHACPDLLPFLEKQQITRKRSIKYKNSSENLVNGAGIKRTCSQNSVSSAKCNSSYLEEKMVVSFLEEDMSFSKDVTLYQVASCHPSNSSGHGTVIANSETFHQNDTKTFESVPSTRTGNMMTDPGALLQAKSANVVEESHCCLLAVDGVLMESKHSECLVQKNIVADEQSCYVGPKDPSLASVARVPVLTVKSLF